MRRSAGIGALRFAGSRMGMSQVGLPTRTKVDPAFRRPLDLSARLQCAPGRPRVVRMPSDWWDSPAVAACALGLSAQSGRTARRFTRNTLREWGLASLADDAEAIVGEFVANAVSHAAPPSVPGQSLGLRLLRRTGEVMCAVLDPSDSAPVLRMPDRNEEAGRGLQMVDALSDVWGWSPVTGRGKAVWAILFCALPLARLLTLPLGAEPHGGERGVASMPWTWRYEKSDGTAVPADDLQEAIFVSQGDAESWLGENWRALLAVGVDQVTLLEDARTEYGPMSLHTED
jgi:anti-sigma regulatory factor (Ser/Thr protein kinase)